VKEIIKFLASSVVVLFLAVNVLILMVLYVKWISKMMGAL
jgi:hypothetical protein